MARQSHDGGVVVGTSCTSLTPAQRQNSSVPLFLFSSQKTLRWRA